jgi:hypothetical protein
MSISAITFTRETMAAPRAAGGGEDRPQGAVHAEADADVVLVGLDVDVAGALGDRVAKQPLHEVDDGRGIGAPAPFEAERALGAEGAAERLDDLGGGETPRHEAVETALGDHPGLDVPVPRGPHDLLKRLVILRVHHAEHEGAVLHGEGDHLAAPDEVLGEQAEHVLLGGERLEVGRGDAELARKGPVELFFREHAQGHQRRPKAAAVHPLVGERHPHLLHVHQPCFDQQFADALAGGCGPGGGREARIVGHGWSRGIGPVRPAHGGL